MPEWNKLPAEVQEIIVQRLNKNTRNLLRVCSKNSKLLVEGTKLKKSLYCLKIEGMNREWKIDTKQCQYHLNSQSFANFEELQANLIKILKSIGYIENLIISLPISTPTIKLINNKDGSRLLVEWVVIKGDGNSQQENILSQLEPAYLSTIVLKSDAQNSRIYDMEQVIHAETLKVNCRSCIREEQLLKLNANHIFIKEVTCSIRNYVNKCNLKTGKRMQIFKFGASSFSVFGLSNISTIRPSFKLKIPKSKLGFEITFKKRDEGSDFVHVFGSLQYENDRNNQNNSESKLWRCDRSLLKIIPSLRIAHNSKDGSWNITVKSLSFRRENYRFQEFQEFQETLDEIMENVDFIKHLYMKLESNKEIDWKPREKKLMVKKLTVEEDKGHLTVQNLLELIDLNFPIDVRFVKNRSINNLYYFYMPQIQNASRVRIANPCLRDSKLLEMNIFYFSIAEGWIEGAYHGGQYGSSNLTPAGITQFLKKCVLHVGKKPINFNLGRLCSGYTTPELFELGNILNSEKMVELLKSEGLDIIGVIEHQDKKQFVINCDHSDYVMNLIVSSQNNFSGFVSYRDQTHPCYPF